MPRFCNSYEAGHFTHWIPATKVHVETRRIPIEIKYLSGNEFEITDPKTKTSHTRHHHEADRLAAFVASHPGSFAIVEDTSFIVSVQKGAVFWFNMSNESLRPCPSQKRETVNNIYLSSNILVGYANGTTWLLSDQKPEDEQTPPTTQTFIITACDPGSQPATLQENHVNTLALEQDLIRNGLEYFIGWGSSQDNLHAELSFCVPVTEPEAADATRQLVTDLARDYGQNAIFEINGNHVTLIPCIDSDAKGEVTKYATLLAEPQSKFKQLLNSLRWLTEVDPEDLKYMNNLISEKFGVTNA
jgi:hypothetical protein